MAEAWGYLGLNLPLRVPPGGGSGRTERRLVFHIGGTEFPTCSPIDEGTCKFHENILSQDCSTQFNWFKKALAAVPADDWLIVVGHAPADEIDVEDFTSAMQSRGFDLYLNGHVHTLTQYTIDGKGAYVTSGAGAMIATEDQHDERAQTKLGGGHVHGYTTAAGVASSHTYQSVWNNKVAGYTLHTFSNDYKTLRTDYVTYQARASSAWAHVPSALLKSSAAPAVAGRRSPLFHRHQGQWPCTVATRPVAVGLVWRRWRLSVHVRLHVHTQGQRSILWHLLIWLLRLRGDEVGLPRLFVAEQRHPRRGGVSEGQVGPSGSTGTTHRVRSEGGEHKPPHSDQGAARRWGATTCALMRLGCHYLCEILRVC